jgi:hypothetical protein
MIGKVSYAAIAGGTLLAMAQCDAPLATYLVVGGFFGAMYAFFQHMADL